MHTRIPSTLAARLVKRNAAAHRAPSALLAQSVGKEDRIGNVAHGVATLAAFPLHGAGRFVFRQAKVALQDALARSTTLRISRRLLTRSFSFLPGTLTLCAHHDAH